MRLRANFGRAPVVLGGAILLASCVPSFISQNRSPDARMDAPGVAQDMPTGPRADYPVIIGDPFTIDGITYTPSDALNHDEVGYATLDAPDATGITGSHRTLPLPSYVEVTSLDSGRTVLVRIERRGPMTNARVIALSSDALEQLQVREGDPVRVRRVNPLEEERAELRAGNPVPMRMETPRGLIDVLKRNLPTVGSASLARTDTPVPVVSTPMQTVDPNSGVIGEPTARELATQQAMPVNEPEPAPSPASKPVLTPVPAPAPQATPKTATPVEKAPAAKPASAKGGYAVQVGAYSSRAAAQKVADGIGGYVEAAGSLWRARIGPFGNRGEASDALAKARSAGYKGALIVSSK